MKQDNILSLLGIAAKARKVVSGESMTEQAVKESRAYLVVVAKDASENTKKLFRDKCKLQLFFMAAEKVLDIVLARRSVRL